jgi:3' terminal RNA ribose 2'-O-methyltransferase Hen1
MEGSSGDLPAVTRSMVFECVPTSGILHAVAYGQPSCDSMLLTLSASGPHAAELGYLLHKHPARLQSFAQSYGIAHVFYPVSDAQRCTAALLVDVDPIGMVRNRRGGGESGLMAQYVNDRPYVASSLLSVALAEVFRSALNGRCAERPQLVAEPLDLEVRVPALPCRGGEALLRELFEPLGYRLELRRLALDPLYPAWGEAACFDTTLRIRAPLQHCLQHLYVLIPVLDNEKHYWVGEAEVDKLLRHAQDWLGAHPARDDIVRRYLRHKRSLTRIALDRLLEAEGEQGEDDVETAEQPAARESPREVALERRISLNQQRIEAVTSAIVASGAARSTSVAARASCSDRCSS